MSARMRTQTLILVSFTFEKSSTFRDSELPVAITNVIYLSVPELESSVFLDSVLLRFTAVALCSSWRSIATSSSATLSCTCFRIFLPSGIQSGEETSWRHRRWKAALEPKLESLFTFTLLLFRTKQGAWHKLIHLMKGSDFPSTRTTNSVRPILDVTRVLAIRASSFYISVKI